MATYGVESTLSNLRRNARNPLPKAGGFFKKSGDVLLSQGASPQVPSALTGLTSVFGMGTGVTLSLWSPKMMLTTGGIASVARLRRSL